MRALGYQRGGVRTNRTVPDEVREVLVRRAAEIGGFVLLALSVATALALATWSAQDPSINFATQGPVENLLGAPGAIISDVLMQTFGVGAVAFLFPVAAWGWRLVMHRGLDRDKLRLLAWALATAFGSGLAASIPAPAGWPLPTGTGGVAGDAMIGLAAMVVPAGDLWSVLTGGIYAVLALACVTVASGFGFRTATTGEDEDDVRNRAIDEEDEADGDRGFGGLFLPIGLVGHYWFSLRGAIARKLRGGALMHSEREARVTGVKDLLRRLDEDGDDEAGFRAPLRATRAPARAPQREPVFADEDDGEDDYAEPAPAPLRASRPSRVGAPAAAPRPGRRIAQEAQPSFLDRDEYELPPLALLAPPKRPGTTSVSPESLEQNARLLEGVLEDFGVKGQIINVRPGPVVTLYELEPAPGIKSSRVIGLADDIARSMSAVSARVAVVPGRNVIGIELPNAKRETVFLRELLASEDFENAKARLPLCLGKTIGGEPVIAELARMPHLLIAGTTGSGKSVAINTMILSLLYRLKPEECRLIMIDPKMLELSVYDGIPHLLAPVVTDPKKAVIALKWAVREMEERYRKMSKVGVRNIDGFNQRVAAAAEKGEIIHRTVQTGFDKETGEAIYEREEMDLERLPYIVVIVDEMADLMLVAGKEIEGTIQRLAQMARAAGIHIIMATQRPSVDVITGTIKANFPTRISFQVTSKIDSRTILSEMGAEQLLGQGDMLHMAGGGRISRVHGPFCSDDEVEKVVDHLKRQGVPDYLDAVTTDDGEAEGGGEDSAVFDKGGFGEPGGDLYDQAIQVVMRDKKCSTSYIQRRLQIGYNRAASLVERMEQEGIVGPANHAGKREILIEEDRVAENY